MSYNSYISWPEMSDLAIGKKIGEFIKHHRLSQNRTQKEVSKDAGLSRSTLSLLERGEKVNLMSLIQVLRVLDLLYVFNDFKVDRQISPLQLAEEDRSKRYRARSKKNKNQPKSDW